MNLMAFIAAVESGQWTSEDWVFVSNLALILVTGATAILMARDAHKTALAKARVDHDEKTDLTDLIHEVVRAEHEEEMARLNNAEPKKETSK